mmetsp:Transcript_74103/g.150465  ORF Transcript_74103/g.150465 Transcript_74103/m.150465 type:complete len:256 (+) Transcript_74103:261-1028(+)
MVVKVRQHLGLALLRAEAILIVRPIADQELEVAERRIATRQLVAHGLCEGSDVVEILELVLLHPILDVVDQLRGEKCGEAKDGGALGLRHRVVPGALCVHEQHSGSLALLVCENEGAAPQPNALCALVLAWPPSKALLFLIAQRALRNPLGITLQDPGGWLLAPVVLPQPPCVLIGLLRNTFRSDLHVCSGCLRHHGIVHHLVVRSDVLALLPGRGSLGLKLRLVLQIAHQQVENEAFSRAVRAHDRNDRDQVRL